MMRKIMLLPLLLFFTMIAFAQTHVISGKVTDESGLPIQFATIKIKGAKSGTSADEFGKFTIAVPANATLVVSAQSMEQAQVNVGNQNEVVVKLKSAGTLSELVFTGVGVGTNKKKLGISVESISGAKLPPVTSIDQALIGKVPGAQISSVSGNPGDKVNIVLRGINTVQGGTRPLVMLDGIEIPFENLSILDLTQVDRVEVVQGAASATIYGAQGANGVIQIFSKKGVKGKLNINVSSSVSQNSFINSGNFGKADKHPFLTDANGNIITGGSSVALGYNKGDIIRIDPILGIIKGSNSISYRYGKNIPGLTNTIPGLANNTTRYGILDPRNVNDQPYVGNLHYYNHFDQVFQQSAGLGNSININGGGDKSDFNVAFSNNRTNSPFLKNNGTLDRSNVTVNLGFEVFKNFSFRTITELAYTKNNMHPKLGAPGGLLFGQGNTNANVGGVQGFLNTSPFFNLTDTIVGGNYASSETASFLSINSFNPYYRLQYTSGNSNRYDLTQNFEANYKLNRFVSLNAKYGITYKNENDVWTFYNQSKNANTEYQGSWTNYNGSDETGEIDNFQYNNTAQNFFGSATVRTDFEKDFNLHIPLQTSTLLAYDYRKKEYKELDTWGQTLAFASPFNLLSTQSRNVASDYVEPFVTYGYIVDQKFDLGSFGGIAGGFRTDYSSAFGAGSKPFTFPHANGYLNLQSFHFWSGLENRISALKLRAAYGKAGIQPNPFDRYPVLNQQAAGNELSYTNQTTSRNPNLDVEVSSEKEIGSDLSIVGGKGKWLKSVNISATYWKRHTDNAIYAQNVPPSTGASQLLTNAITLSSNGWQLGVNIPVLTSKNFTWDVTANFGHQVSTIDAVAGGDIPLLTASGATGLVLAAGRKIGEIYGYKALTSVNQLRGDGKTSFIDAASQSNYEIVDGRVVNKITKAIFFSDEATSLGDPNPTLTSSFISNTTYKNTISFGFQIDWVQGAHLYCQTKEWMYRDGISNDFTKPVTINGETKAFTAYYASAYYALGTTPKGVGNNATKDYFYYDASFVRLRNVSLGIDFSKITKKEWLKRCQMVLTGRNLLTFTKYPGLDPEISSGASNSTYDRGVDYSTYPNTKTYQITLNLGF